jgi:hypothetical protein
MTGLLKYDKCFRKVLFSRQFIKSFPILVQTLLRFSYYFLYLGDHPLHHAFNTGLQRDHG